MLPAGWGLARLYTKWCIDIVIVKVYYLSILTDERTVWQIKND
jgi:hypothetical protein